MPPSPDEPPPPKRRFGPGTAVSVVVPCFNEEEVLPALFDRLGAAARAWGAEHEVILVDDGSSDRTWAIACEQNARDPRWKALRLARNLGHQIALFAGLHAAGGEVVAVLDADLQDPPEALPDLFAKWSEGYDVVYAVRSERHERAWKRLGYFVFYRLLALLTEFDQPLDSGDFCVMDRRLVRVLTSLGDRRPFVRGLRAWAGFRQCGVPVARPRRAAGRPKYTLQKLVALAIDGILSSSNRPLRIATWLGFIFSTLAFAGAIFTLLQRIFREQFAAIGLEPVPGFATTVIAILFLGGVQLVCLGIVGEYVGRIAENVRGRPAWIGSDSLGLDAGQRERAGFEPESPPPHPDPLPGGEREEA